MNQNRSFSRCLRAICLLSIASAAVAVPGAVAFGGPVTPVSVSPNSGYAQVGVTRTFSFLFSDAQGYSDIKGANILFNTTFSGTNGCWLYFDRAANMLAMATDNTAIWNQASLASANTLQNSQCRVSWTNTSPVAASGNTLTLSLSFTFLYTWRGKSATIFMRGLDVGGGDSGYIAKGSWLVTEGLPYFSVDFVPQQGSVLAGANGTVPVVLPGGVVVYSVIVTRYGGFEGPVSITMDTIGVPLTATLNRSTIPAGETSAQLTIQTAPSISLGLYPMYAGGGQSLGLFLRFTGSGVSEVQKYAPFGVVNRPPTLTLISNSNNGSFWGVAVKTADTAGSYDIVGVNILINDTLTGQNACWLYYGLPYHRLVNGRYTEIAYLANNDASQWNVIPVGSTTSVANSQCEVVGQGDLFPRSDVTSWTIPMGFRFSPTFSGTKTIWVRAVNKFGFDTGYQALGQIN